MKKTINAQSQERDALGLVKISDGKGPESDMPDVAFRSYEDVVAKIADKHQEYLKGPFYYKWNLFKGPQIKSLSFEYGSKCLVWPELLKSVTEQSISELSVRHDVTFRTVKREATLTPLLSFEFANAGVVTLSIKGSRIVIGKVVVNPGAEGFGLGSLMMNVIVVLLQRLSSDVTVELDCLGSVLHNGKMHSMPIEKQVRFFKKFGFKIGKKKFNKRKEKLVQVSMSGAASSLSCTADFKTEFESFLLAA